MSICVFVSIYIMKHSHSLSIGAAGNIGIIEKARSNGFLPSPRVLPGDFFIKRCQQSFLLSDNFYNTEAS